jgi:hypothetical protein
MTELTVNIFDVQSVLVSGHSLVDEAQNICREVLLELYAKDELPSDGKLHNQSFGDAEVSITGNNAGYYQVSIEFHRADKKADNPKVFCNAALRHAHHSAKDEGLAIVVYKDGNRWCALHGLNLQDGWSGWGDSPGQALDLLLDNLEERDSKVNLVLES